MSKPRARTTIARVAALALLAVGATACDLVAPEGPAPLRYRDATFTQVTKTADITYAQVVDRQGETQTLKFDLYEPTGDTLARRPLIIWIHGGSFAFGSRTSPEIVDEANTFAKKGYLNASISYRLSEQGCTVIGAECIESIYDAIEDAQGAVRFFRRYAARYGIDVNRIAVAGTSAGAITALNVGYATTVPEPSGPAGYSTRVNAAVSLSGAVIFTGSVSPGDAPALLFHGTADRLVPYSWAQATIDNAKADRLKAFLVRWEGDGHVPYIEHRSQILDLTTNFLYSTLNLADA